jgi:hypothetical protein
MKARHIYIPLLLGVITPTAVILVLELIGERRLSLFLGDLLRTIPFITAFALIPFVALIGALYGFASLGVKGWRLECIFWGGLIAAEYVIVRSHWAVWYPWYFGNERLSATSVVMFVGHQSWRFGICWSACWLDTYCRGSRWVSVGSVSNKVES